MLAAARNTPARLGSVRSVGLATAAVIYMGALVCVNATGYAVRGDAVATLRGLGRAKQTVDNSAGQDGDLSIEVETGVFLFGNSAAADEITTADLDNLCYVVDDETVAKTNGGGTRGVAGYIIDVDERGVWVGFGAGAQNAPAGGLLAAQNLNDVANKATAFANIKQAATVAATGVAELATSAETLTGTDVARVVTPKGAADTYASKLGATFAVGVEGGNAINVAVQITDAAGVDLAVRGSVLAYLSDDEFGNSIIAVAPSGGVAIGVDGLAIPLVANKAFQLTSEADGDIDLTITEAGVKTCYLILVMPDGRLLASPAITFA